MKRKKTMVPSNQLVLFTITLSEILASANQSPPKETEKDDNLKQLQDLAKKLGGTVSQMGNKQYFNNDLLAENTIEARYVKSSFSGIWHNNQ